MQLTRLIKYMRNIRKVNGWFNPEFVYYTLIPINTAQNILGVEGNILELGVFKGRSLLPFLCIKNPDEVVIGVDNFRAKEKVCCGNKPKPIRPQMWRNLNKWYGRVSEHMWLWEKATREIPQEDLLRRAPFRMIHIDADHAGKEITHDLELVVPHLHKLGALFVDDYGNKEWPDVKEATDKFMASKTHNLKKLFVRFNKAVYVPEELYDQLSFMNNPIKK